MASFNDPKLSNHIADDVPAIRQLLRSVATFDPATGNTDIPNGAKRLVETAQGYEFQSYNGTAWVTLEKWNLDVQKVDGYSASTGTTASTIPVRDASGKIPGDITGNAATASKAKELSETNPIATGGTGGTTAEQARLNLGTPPKNHASGSTEFGAGSTTQYGHLKSHDAPDATKTAATGHAFSPAGAAAMQEALEEGIEEAKRNAESAHFTATIDGLDLVLSFEDGTEKRVKLPAGKSVGDLWIGFDPASKPANVQIFGGQLLSRTAYEAHSAMVLGGERTVLTDAEWQEQVAANGFCPFYSSGDGSTTYRMPLIKGVHPKFVAALAEAGSFVAAGLPDFYGQVDQVLSSTGAANNSMGAMGIVGSGSYAAAYASPGAYAAGTIYVQPSRSNLIYGNSDTVQPPAVTCVLGEYVFGAVSRIGEADIEELAERIDKLETRAPGVSLGTLLPYTGKDVPAGTLRPDGTVYNMKAAFPDFYDWVLKYGPTVPLSEYTLVEGNCGYYGLDETTGTVRMPTITNGFVGAATAGQYGRAVQAGLPGFTATNDMVTSGAASITSHAGINCVGYEATTPTAHIDVDASRSSPIYGRSDTDTPTHVKYPWVIVVYNAAVPPSVAEAAEFIGLLDGKMDKTGGTLQGDLVVYSGFVKRPDTSGELLIRGGTNLENGGAVICYGQDAISEYGYGQVLIRGAKHGRICDVVVKPDVGLTVDGSPVVSLVASWHSGNSWYRKYSDGFIEQGGLATTTRDRFNTDVTLHTPFASSNYTVQVTDNGGTDTADGTYIGGVYVPSVSTSKFQIHTGWGGTHYWRWYACGY